MAATGSKLSWSEVRFAPSGQQIIGRANGGIYSINVDGTHLRRLAPEGADPAMSNDGYLAYQNGLTLHFIAPEPLSAEPGGYGTSHEISVPIQNFNSSGSSSFTFIPGTHTLAYPSQSGLRYFDAATGSQTGFKPNIKDQNLSFLNSTIGYDCALNGIYETLTMYKLETEEVIPYSPEDPGCQLTRFSEGYGNVRPPGLRPSEAELLQAYAPVIKYDSEEPYRAISPESETNLKTTHVNPETGKYDYLGRLFRGQSVIASSLFYKSEAETGYKAQGYFPLTLESLGATYPAEIGKEGFAAQASDHLDEHDGTEQEDAEKFTPSPETAYAYGHAIPTSSGVWLQYWYFYYYNIGSDVGFDNHEGDWEMVQLFVDRASGYLPRQMIFSQHAHQVVCPLGEYELEGSPLGYGARPVVHVAFGTHANYPYGGYYASEFPGYTDAATFDRSQENPTQTTLYYGEPFATPHLPTWLSWPGQWGGSANSPRGPRFGSSHEKAWYEPSAYAAEAKECLFNLGRKDQERGAAMRAAAQSDSASTATMTRSAPEVKNGKLSVIVDTRQLSSSSPTRIVVSTRGVSYLHPPQSISLGKYVGRKRVTFPIGVAQGNTQRITGSALVATYEQVFAAPITK